MKYLFVILALIVVGPAAAQWGDCIICPLMDPLRFARPNPPIRNITRVVAPLVNIETPALTRNSRASYCLRNENLVDTIVFHHSGGPSTSSVTDINSGHVEHVSGRDPWLMTGYHYSINSRYGDGSPQDRAVTARVSAARPFNITGAHVGTDIFASVSPQTATLLRQNSSIRCGVRGTTFTTPDDRFNAAGQAKGNYTTVGVVIIGNYSQRSSSNDDGYAPGRPRYPSASTIDLAGRLACELQRRHPRITKIRAHSSFHSTECPGTIAQRLQEIKNSARRFGCTFQ